MTSDTEAAQKFYRAVLGGGTGAFAMPDMSYTQFTADQVLTSNFVSRQNALQPRPGWIGYVAVDDLDESVASVIRAGGSVRRAPNKLANADRFAVVSDPQGGTLALFHRGSVSTAPRKTSPSVWHELHVADREAAFAFYAGLFAWQKGEALDMGQMGLYQIFEKDHDMLGGMMTKPANIPGPFWLYYFNVAAIKPAMALVSEGGGKILNGPHQVPGGSWIVQCVDPQGGLFALVETK
jgi:predicted enzyme related to lactoylglutathione lyase